MRYKIDRIKSAFERIVLLSMDLLSVMLLYWLSALVRTDVLPHIYRGFPQEFPFKGFFHTAWIYIVWIFFTHYEGLYTRMLSFWDELRGLWRVSFFSTIGIFTLASISKLRLDVSRTTIILMGILSLISLPLVRMSAKRILRKMGFLKRRVLILGAGKTGQRIAGVLRRDLNYGVEIIGFLDDDLSKAGNKIDGIKVHKGVDRASSYLRRSLITDVVVAMPGAGKDRIQGIINSLQHQVQRLFYIPDLFGVAVLGTTLHHFFTEQAFALEMKNNLARPMNIIIKRTFDFLVSVLILPVFLPIILVLSVLVRLDSKGPIIFRQERIGKHGKPFLCYKFRTMFEDSEQRLYKLLELNPETRREWNEFWKLKDDPRVTKIGRFLRSTSLDELPQIFNVLKGEMSLVGPRPYLSREKDALEGYSHIILSVPPGITGLWQTSGRSNKTCRERMALDLWYVRNWNLWLDIIILLKSLNVVLRREGAC
jgi:Undecaprenyl-phosphate galactose phosphotransferase WbaP